MTRPERSPDFVYKTWEFFFEEEVQWNTGEELLYDIKVDNDLEVMFSDHESNSWAVYELGGGESAVITDAYLNWLIEKELLCS
jgi:hypothetical protein